MIIIHEFTLLSIILFFIFITYVIFTYLYDCNVNCKINFYKNINYQNENNNKIDDYNNLNLDNSENFNNIENKDINNTTINFNNSDEYLDNLINNIIK